MKRTLQLLGTASYLISAFVITAATSKSRPEGTRVNFAGETNLAVQSTCPNRPNVDLVRVSSGTITDAMTWTGQIVPVNNLDFRSFGFPTVQAFIGLNQHSSQPDSNDRCLVKTKSNRPDSTYDSTKTEYHFISPGSLTQVVYECTIGAIQCTTIFEELPAGDFRSIGAQEKPAAR